MVQRLKRWESPRKQGRNDKGKGGTARARQLRKREQMLRQKLKSNGSSNIRKVQATGEGNHTLSFLLATIFICLQESLCNPVLLWTLISDHPNLCFG